MTGHGPARRRLLGCLAVLALLPACALAAPKPGGFTLAVIPDPQNYLDYSHQKAGGYPFDARDMFAEQMRYVAANLQSAGGDVAFVSAVGDIWQHGTEVIDPGHAARGFKPRPDTASDSHMGPTEKTMTVEAPAAREAFQLIAGKVPFSVVPGNHDYDAQWWADGYPHTAASLGLIHVGGLSNFNSVFGADTAFFKGQPWYVASFNGGADSAQIFTAGGYRFLHIGLEFAPPNEALAWATSVIKAHPGLPVIVTTHDFLDQDGRRLPNPLVDMRKVDPRDNNPQDVWDKFVRRNDRIFLVLSGHEHGQSRRVDANDAGHQVHQVMADYQNRGQTAIDAGVPKTPAPNVGDGWMRLMTFDLSAPTPTIRVRTYSTRYKAFSGDVPQYAAWYRPDEQPKMTDAAFPAQDDLTLQLTDFRQRFGKARAR